MSNPNSPNEMTRAQPVDAGVAKREEFGASQMVRVAETAGSAMAAQAKAAIEARYIIALQRPRDMMLVRQKILVECMRPQFAKVARYLKPIGKGIVGPSIRFAEAAMRCMTNIYPETMTIYDDETKRILRVTVTDLESNLGYAKDITIDKTVERSNANGCEVLSMRTNSRGDRTYTIRATDDDLLNKENALVSKALRTGALRLLPGDILDEAMDQVTLTMKTEDAKDPAAARKGIVDSFARIGVTVVMLAEYLGHPVDQLTPDEITQIRALGYAIKDGEARWTDAVEQRKAERAGTSDPAKTPAPLKDRIKEQAAKTGKKGAEPTAATPTATTASTPATEPAKAATAPANGPHMHNGEPTDGEPPADYIVLVSGRLTVPGG